MNGSSTEYKNLYFYKPGKRVDIIRTDYASVQELLT